MTLDFLRLNHPPHNMDIKVSRGSGRLLKVIATALISLVLMLLWWWAQPPRLKLDELLFAEVKQGNFQNKLQVSGQFKPLDQFWLVAPADGVLTSLQVRPGAVLEPEQLLATITSQTLEQDIRKLQSACSQAEAEYNAQQAQFEIDFSAAEIALLQARHLAETSKMDKETNAPLLASGIISRLQFEKLQKIALQHALTLKAKEQRLQAIKRLQQAKLAAIRMKNQQMLSELEDLRLLQQSLYIRASTAGMVTQFAENLTLGQTMVAGSPILQVAGSNSLYAELYVPAMYASSLQHGLLVTLSLRSGFVLGEISRIDPRAVNDRIVVDVLLPQPLPVEARAELAVRADILLSERTASVFVQRPFYVQADKQQSVFVRSADGLGIDKREVEFGSISGNLIEVHNGLKPGEVLLLTEVEPHLLHHSRIVLES